MRYLLVLLLSLLTGVSGCAIESEANEAQMNETVDSSRRLEEVDNEELGSSPQTSEEAGIKETVESYVNGADEQNVELVESSFHTDFQVFAYSEESVRVLDKTTYLELLSAGTIGGSRRQIKYLDLHVDGPIGTARVDLVGEDVTFHDHLSLMLAEGSWKIVSNVTYIAPNP